jgi:hypothetical protein
MDGTFKYYLKTDADQAFQAIKTVIDNVRNVNGLFVSVWHNESFSDREEEAGWAKLYHRMMEYVHE